MKKKIIFTFFAVLILNVIPLLFKPELILNYKTIILAVTACILWLSQPAFSTNEMNMDKKNDKLSILLILIASSISVLSAVIEWGYFTQNKSEMNFVSMTGLVMLLGGTAVRVWAIYILGKNFTATVKVTAKHELIREGPYSVVRHPSYLGALIAITGCPVFLNNIYSVFIAFFLMMLVYYFRITFEEKVLEEHFGNAYINYKKNTYRLLPFIW